MFADAEFRSGVEKAMHDDDRLLAAMKQLLERAWAFVTDPQPA